MLLLAVLEVQIAPDLTSESPSVSSLTWPVPSFSGDFLALGTIFCRSFSVSSAGVASPWNLGWWRLHLETKGRVQAGLLLLSYDCLQVFSTPFMHTHSSSFLRGTHTYAHL